MRNAENANNCFLAMKQTRCELRKYAEKIYVEKIHGENLRKYALPEDGVYISTVSLVTA